MIRVESKLSWNMHRSLPTSCVNGESSAREDSSVHIYILIYLYITGVPFPGPWARKLQISGIGPGAKNLFLVFEVSKPRFMCFGRPRQVLWDRILGLFLAFV